MLTYTDPITTSPRGSIQEAIETNQQSHIADPAAPAAMTFAAGSIDTGTDMTAAEAAAIVADLAALRVAVVANKAAIDAALVVNESYGLTATS